MVAANSLCATHCEHASSDSELEVRPASPLSEGPPCLPAAVGCMQLAAWLGLGGSSVHTKGHRWPQLECRGPVIVTSTRTV